MSGEPMDRPPAKERVKAEFAKIGAMTPREKWEYIWEYYKIHIIGFAIIAFVLGSLINTWFINPPKSNALFIGWVGGYATHEQMRALADVLIDALPIDHERQTVEVSDFFLMDDPAYNNAVYSRMMAMIATGGIDLFILTKEEAEDYAASGTIAPMDEVLAEARAANRRFYDAQVAPRELALAWQPDEGSPARDHKMGLSLLGCRLFAELGILDLELYLCMSATASNHENIIYALEVLYG